MVGTNSTYVLKGSEFSSKNTVSDDSKNHPSSVLIKISLIQHASRISSFEGKQLSSNYFFGLQCEYKNQGTLSIPEIARNDGVPDIQVFSWPFKEERKCTFTVGI